ncbi:extracellular solute-binding protein [Egibacter rhizosphaerae]|uniref:Extracellular solute-binding protein n=1 Tax=Egibacter rhizosphaerae TaxID=1670831 RepID=A0A411YAY9_9ACTN|nr:extracellular solute-binding protein [Egibacter rhizosphaerae]QBI18356.1 extracellular solute-binding protein [Egibacter rhizosphaerae]
MRVKSSRKVSVIALLMAVGLFAAACGEDLTDEVADADDAEADPEAEGEEETEGEEEVEEETFEMEQPDTPGEDIELEFWTFVDLHAEFLIAQAERFNEENEDYNIILDATSISFDEMHDRTLIALESGTGAPDLVDLEIQRFATFTRGEVQLLPLDDVLDPYRDDLVEERMAPYEVDGTPYGIDYHLGAFVTYYNQDIMDEAGVDVDDIETWDDYVDVGLEVQENTDITAFASVETLNRLSLLGPMLQNDGGLYDASNESIIDSPENVEAVEMVSDMVHEHGVADLAPGGGHAEPEFYEAFNNGEFASVWMPQWYMSRFPDLMPDLEGSMVVRPMPAFEEGGTISTMGGGTGTAITNQIDDDKVQAAQEFIGYAKLSYDAQVRVWTDLDFDPFRMDVYEDPALSEPEPFFADEPVLTMIEETLDRLAPEYTGPRYPESILALEEEVVFPVLSDGEDPAETLADTQAEIDAYDD